MNNNPLISVVMATFNEPPVFITQAVQSILDQTVSDFELLITDDSTNKNTIAAINKFTRADSRIRVIRTPECIGFVKALNAGLKQARGKYIARMDGDDISLPNRFEIQVAFLEGNPDIAVVGGAMDIINAEGKVTSHRDYAISSGKLRLYTLFRSPVAHPAVMFRKEIVEKGFYYDENFKKAEDLELWLRLLKNHYAIMNVPDTVLCYRVTDNLADKRNKEHFGYSYRARKKNFSWEYPFWSACSVLISRIYVGLPKFIIAFIYKKEM